MFIVMRYCSAIVRIVATVGVCLPACNSRDRGVVLEAIPGTERVVALDFSISVSPDEKWLLLVEWKLPDRQIPPDDYQFRVVSLDLQTNQRTEHSIESIRPQSLGFSTRNRRWKQQAGLAIIQKRFVPPGWRNGKFFFQPYRFNRRYETTLVLEPGVPGLTTAATPIDPGRCADCYPGNKVRFRNYTWELVPPPGEMVDPVSVVAGNGSVTAVYYVRTIDEEHPDDRRSIYRLSDDGDSPEVVVNELASEGVMIQIVSVRVSPDGRYLAYVVDSKKQAFLSPHRKELRMMDLTSSKDKRVGTYNDTGNLIWSGDGNRLYFAAEHGSDAAVYVVDASATFKR